MYKDNTEGLMNPRIQKNKMSRMKYCACKNKVQTYCIDKFLAAQ